MQTRILTQPLKSALRVKRSGTHRITVHLKSWLFCLNHQRCNSCMRVSKVIRETLVNRVFNQLQEGTGRTTTRSTTWTSLSSQKTTSRFTRKTSRTSILRSHTGRWPRPSRLQEHLLFIRQWCIKTCTSQMFFTITKKQNLVLRL